MERLPAYITMNGSKYVHCILITHHKDINGTLGVRMPERMQVYVNISKNGYAYLKNSTPVFVYVKGWLYDCKNKIEPRYIDKSNSAQQVEALYEAMKCL